MACPTCDHTMQGIGTQGAFWCPRCGTIMSGFVPESPWLVKRCRHFHTELRHQGLRLRR